MVAYLYIISMSTFVRVCRVLRVTRMFFVTSTFVIACLWDTLAVDRINR
jgi:hypothetical protein